MSITALITAYARAYHHLYDEPKLFDDDLARSFLTDEEFEFISNQFKNGIEMFHPNPKEIQNPIKYIIQTQLAPQTLSRSRYAEEVLENEIKLGATQYVILGAGYDTYAFRTTNKLLNIFECDHPDTQQLKLDKLYLLNWEIPSSLRFVPIDFTKDSIKKKLLHSNFKTNEKTVMSWLGVTYYLTKSDIQHTLKELSSVIPKGSAIVFDYPDEHLHTSNVLRVQNMIKLAKASGEEMKQGYSYNEMEQLLQEAGFLIYDYLEPKDIENRYFKDRNDYYHAFEHTNFILAVKQ